MVPTNLCSKASLCGYKLCPSIIIAQIIHTEINHVTKPNFISKMFQNFRKFLTHFNIFYQGTDPNLHKMTTRSPNFGDQSPLNFALLTVQISNH